MAENASRCLLIADNQTIDLHREVRMLQLVTWRQTKKCRIYDTSFGPQALESLHEPNDFDKYPV